MAELKKELGLLHVFCIAGGAMISSGLFILPGIAFEIAGPAIILSYALAGMLMIPTMLSQAELATAMPKSGGSYFFVERTLGPLAGTVAGLANWLSITLKASFALIGIGALASLMAPGDALWLEKLVAVGACLVFAALNVFSVKGTGRLQIWLVAGLLAILAVYIAFGAFAPRNETRFADFLKEGWPSVFAVAGMVFVSYGGLTKVVDVSGEVRNSARNVPLGMFLAFAVVNVLYVLVVTVTVNVLPGDVLSGSKAPLTEGARAMLGPAGAILVSIAALFAFATTANAGILSASRSPMAMSRDGLLPRVLARTSRRFGTPIFAIVFTVAFAIPAVTLLSVSDLAKTASTMMILMFILVNVAVIIMRQSGFQSYRPRFRAPLYPWLQIVAIVTYGFLIVEMGTIPQVLTGLFALLSGLWYLFYVHRRINRESVFVYMVKNIVSRHIKRSGLEEELRQIALDADHTKLDRFDRLIQDCDILDIKESLTARDLFRRVAGVLARRLDAKEETLYELLLERERQSPTVVKPGLAIPHVIVKGEHVFDIVLVRAKEGVVFSDLNPPVTTAFVLVGSADERNYHLRALMAIAHIVEESDFDTRWHAAHNAEQLRDIVLLSQRKRLE